MDSFVLLFTMNLGKVIVPPQYGDTGNQWATESPLKSKHSVCILFLRTFCSHRKNRSQDVPKRTALCWRKGSGECHPISLTGF